MRFGIKRALVAIGAMLGFGAAAASAQPSMQAINAPSGDTGWPDFMPTMGRRGNWISASRPNQAPPRRRKFRKKLRYARA